jgi:molybdopterin synthase catalytic subunit
MKKRKSSKRHLLSILKASIENRRRAVECQGYSMMCYDISRMRRQPMLEEKSLQRVGTMNFEITKDSIQIQAVIDKVVAREAGAITTFIGTVRELTNGKKTLFLIYEAYESMAVKKLEQIGNEIMERWPGARVAITHRVGKLDITDVAVVIAVSTPHRNDAYEANRYAIERIKEIVPIWKKEHWEDGEKWIGNQLETVSYPTGKPEQEDLHG